MPGLASSRWAVSSEGRSSSVPAPSTRLAAGGGSRASESTAVHLERLPDTVKTAASEASAGEAAAGEAATGELARYSKIVRRMKWKLPFLDVAYQRAAIGLAQDSVSMVEAELMFKLDFFEYYMLCERALVHLQGVFGIVISAGTGGKDGENNAGAGARSHRYHANVLEALDREDNPLHSVLGVGNIRRQLARAKDLRNRWKNADAESSGPQKAVHSRDDKHIVPPLSTYDVAGIMAAIHDGLDKAFTVASQHASAKASTQSPGLNDDQAGRPVPMEMDTVMTEEEEWGFMVEAMDWEAV